MTKVFHFFAIFLSLTFLNALPVYCQQKLSSEASVDLVKAAQFSRIGDFDQSLEILEDLRQRHPEEKRILFDYLTTLTWAGRYQQAADLATEIDPASAPEYVLAAAATACRHSGKLELAEHIYREGQRRFPEQPDFILGDVMTLADGNRLAEARQLLEQFKSQESAKEPEDPAKGPDDATKGSERTIDSRTAEIEQHLANMEARVREDEFQARRDEGAELARQGQYDEALDHLVRLKSERPDSEALTFDYLTILSWAGRHQEAAELADRLEAGRFPVYVLEAAARSYRETGQYDKSERLYQLGLSREPDNAKLAAGLQLTQNRRDGVEPASDLEGGTRREAAAGETTGSLFPPVENIAAVKDSRDKAVALARSGDYRGSLRILEGLQNEYPEDQSILGDRIVIHGWAGQYARAAKLVDQLKLKLEEVPEYLASSASSSLRRSGRLKNAAAWYEAALIHFPDSLDLNVGYALTLGDGGRPQMGLDRLKAFTRQHPLADKTQINEAQAYLRKQLAGAASPRPSPPSRPRTPYRDEQDRAVLAARDGRLEEGLRVLARLHQDHPQDQALLADYLTLLVWNQDYRLAQSLVPRLDMSKAPTYAIESAAEAYLGLNDYARAQDYVRTAIRKQNRPPDLLLTGALVMGRSGNYVQAAAYIDEAENSRWPGLSGRIEEAKKAIGYKRVKALARLARLNKILTLNPYDRQALQLKAQTLDAAGAGDLAWDLTRPGLNLSARQLDDLERAAGLKEVAGEAIAGPVPSRNIHYQRYLEALSALDRLRVDPDCLPDYLCRTKVRQARLRPLAELNRRAELVEEYEALRGEGIQVPSPAVFLAADAYLALRRPEEAEDIYRKLINRQYDGRELTSGELYDAQKGLFWSLLDAGHLSEALELARDNYESRRQTAGARPGAAEDWAAADSYQTLGLAYLYTGFLSKGEKQFQEMAAAEPSQASILAGLATSQALRGRPRMALDIYGQARALSPNDIGLMVQEANALMAAKKWRQAHDLIKSLEAYAPYDEPVSRLVRAWETHNLFEARAGLTWTDTDSSSPNAYTPGQSPAFEATLHSPPINYNWRIYLGTALESGKFIEGHAHQEMALGGLEYRDDWLELNLEARGAQINRPSRDDGRNRAATRRAGGGISGVISPDDHWRLYFSAQRDSRNTPLRALYDGVTANEYLLGAAHHWNEGRYLRLTGSYMDFTDGNERLAVGAIFNQRLLSAYSHTLDAQVSLYSSRNSEDDDRMYYNPKEDFSYGLDLIYNGPIWRSYDKALTHTISGSLGNYHQKHFGSDTTWRLDYRHNLDWTDRFAASYGVGYGRRIYDGDPEKNLDLYLNIIWKF